jgi:hypothetical protein
VIRTGEDVGSRVITLRWVDPERADVHVRHFLPIPAQTARSPQRTDARDNTAAAGFGSCHSPHRRSTRLLHSGLPNVSADRPRRTRHLVHGCPRAIAPD